MDRKQVTKKNEQEFSKFLSYILRHKPEEIGLELEDNGWVNVGSLIIAINNHEASKWVIDMAVLEQVVVNDSKNRYSFNNHKTKIRANQGHSIKNLVMDFEEVNPPEYLYHGTSEENAKLIIKSGEIKPMSRQMVHLSKDIETAEKVGKRHGKPVIFRVEAQRMKQNGKKFYISENGVYLVDNVSTEFTVMEIQL